MCKLYHRRDRWVGWREARYHLSRGNIQKSEEWACICSFITWITLGIHVSYPLALRFGVSSFIKTVYGSSFQNLNQWLEKKKVWPHNKYAFILTTFKNMHPYSYLYSVQCILVSYWISFWKCWFWLTELTFRTLMGYDTWFEERRVWSFW